MKKKIKNKLKIEKEEKRKGGEKKDFFFFFRESVNLRVTKNDDDNKIK